LCPNDTIDSKEGTLVQQLLTYIEINRYSIKISKDSIIVMNGIEANISYSEAIDSDVIAVINMQ
jgi:hypothetical protein